jgi:S-methylmethionine-dependent homocysteine/selenocysteine methylase
MKPKSFLTRLSEPTPIILDGATGSELSNRGVNTGLPLWSSWALIDAPNILSQIHYDYLSAGAEVITTNTFRTHRRSLAKAGMENKAFELTSQAVTIARDVVNFFINEGGHQAWVAGSISPLEDCYLPELVPPQKECEDEHLEIASTLAEAGADLILIETMNSIRESVAAIEGAKITKLPFLVSFVLNSEGNLLSGEPLDEMVLAISDYAPTMIGINCTPTQTIGTSLEKLKSLSDIPIFGYGNIGHTDHVIGWTNTEEVSPSKYTAMAEEWLLTGVKMIGGCCGTSPEYIKQVVSQIRGNK